MPYCFKKAQSGHTDIQPRNLTQSHKQTIYVRNGRGSVFLTPGVHGSNPVIGEFLNRIFIYLLPTVLKRQK